MRKRVAAPVAAEFIGLSVSTLAKLRCVGGGPQYYKLGRKIVYDIEDLEAWLELRHRSNTSEAD